MCWIRPLQTHRWPMSVRIGHGLRALVHLSRMGAMPGDAGHLFSTGGFRLSAFASLQGIGGVPGEDGQVCQGIA